MNTFMNYKFCTKKFENKNENQNENENENDNESKQKTIFFNNL